jgi:hypothetical protein
MAQNGNVSILLGEGELYGCIIEIIPVHGEHLQQIRIL